MCKGIACFIVFLIIGLVVKGFEDRWFKKSSWIHPKDFWKETFISELHSSNCNGSVECAVNRADLITRGNSCTVPSYEEKKRIIKALGYGEYLTEKDKYEEIGRKAKEDIERMRKEYKKSLGIDD